MLYSDYSIFSRINLLVKPLSLLLKAGVLALILFLSKSARENRGNDETAANRNFPSAEATATVSQVNLPEPFSQNK